MIATALFVLAAAAQDAPKPREITLPCDWKVGTQLAITSERGEEHRQGDRLLTSTATRTPLLLEVTERRDDGYTMRWTFGRPEIVVSSEPPAAHADVIASLLDGLVLDLLTDPFGVARAVADPAGLDAQLGRIAKTKHDALVASGTSPQDARYVLVHAEGARGPMFHASLMRGPQLFLMATGAKLVLGVRNAWDDELPNPFGGAPIPSRSQIWLASVDDAKREAVIEWRNSVDPVRGKSVIEAAIRAEAQRKKQELPPNAVFDLGAIEDASTTTFDLATGWPKSMVYTRTSVMFEVRRIDTVSMDAKLVEAK